MVKPTLHLGIAVGLLVSTIAAQEVPKPARMDLQVPASIQGYPCALGHAWFYADGRLSRCTLSHNAAVGDVSAPAGSLIDLRRDGSPLRVLPPYPLQLGAIHCAGGSLLGPGEGAAIELYPSGKLRLCFLVGDQVVDGVPCASGGIAKAVFGHEYPVEFREDGRLKSCGLSRDFHNHRKGEKFQN